MIRKFDNKLYQIKKDGLTDSPPSRPLYFWNRQAVLGRPLQAGVKGVAQAIP
jgi:hypothetical protein